MDTVEENPLSGWDLGRHPVRGGQGGEDWRVKKAQVIRAIPAKATVCDLLAVQRGRGEEAAESYLKEIMPENFLNQETDLDILVAEAHGPKQT